ALIIFMVFHPSIQHRGCYLDCVFVPHRKNPLLSARLKSVPPKRNCRALQLRSTTWKFYVQLQCFISRQCRSTGPFSCVSQQTSAESSYAFSAALQTTPHGDGRQTGASRASTAQTLPLFLNT